jgi:tetratricopeptide (TPR) repeat protein
VPVNLQDWQPNASEPSVSDGFEAALALGRNALDEGRGPAAVAAFDRALALAPRSADAHFFRGRALLRLGRDEEAREAFESAVRFDQNPFRALPVMNDIVRHVAAAHPGAILVDAERAFARASATGSPGFDLFLDYVHPSLRGNRVLAAAVYDAIREHDLLGLEPPMVRINFRTQEAAAAGYRDEDDLAMQGVMLWAFGLNRQEETLVARARALRPRLIDAEEPIGEEARLRMLAFIDDVESSVAPALDRARAERAGHALPPAEATHVSANLDAFYRRWYEEGNRPWTDARL